MNPASNTTKSDDGYEWLTKETEKHKNKNKYSAQPKKFKHVHNIENNGLPTKEIKSNMKSILNVTEKLVNNNYNNELEKDRTKNKKKYALSENSEKSKEKRMRKKRLKTNSASSHTVASSNRKKLNDTASPQSNTILKWVNKSTNNSASTSSTEKYSENLSITDGISNLYSNKQKIINAPDSLKINNIIDKKNYKIKPAKQDIKHTLTEKNKNSFHTPSEEKKNLQEKRSPVHIKSAKLNHDKCSVSKTLFLSCPQSGNLQAKSSKQTTKSNGRSPLSNEVTKKRHKNGLDKSNCKRKAHRNTNKLKTKQENEDINMTLTKKNKNPCHTRTEEKKSLPKKYAHIMSPKLSSNSCSVSKTYSPLCPQSGSISIKSSKYTTNSNSNSTNEVAQKSHENSLDNLKCKIKEHGNTNKPNINRKKDSMTHMDNISTKKRKKGTSSKKVALQTLDVYLSERSEKSNKRKLCKKEGRENCEFSVLNDNKRLKPRKSNDSFNKYGVAVPSVEEILKEQKDFVQYKNQIESFQDIIDENKFDIPFSVKTCKNSEVVRQNVLDCKHLTTQEIEKAFYINLDYISAIFNGQTDNERHARFFSTNVKSYTFTVKDLCYNTSTIVFKFEQQEHMIALLKKEFDPSDRWTLYFFQVLLPELCLKIFMDTHCMDYDEAVKYLDTRPILDD